MTGLPAPFCYTKLLRSTPHVICKVLSKFSGHSSSKVTHATQLQELKFSNFSITKDKSK